MDGAILDWASPPPPLCKGKERMLYYTWWRGCAAHERRITWELDVADHPWI